MANRDLVSSGNATGSPPLDRIVEPEAAFGGELENDDGDEHLRDARYAEPVIDPHRSARLHARKPARSLPCPRAVGDDRHPARRAAGLEHVAQELLNARRRGRCARCIGWRGTDRRRRRERGRRHGDRDRDPSGCRNSARLPSIRRSRSARSGRRAPRTATASASNSLAVMTARRGTLARSRGSRRCSDGRRRSCRTTSRRRRSRLRSGARRSRRRRRRPRPARLRPRTCRR